jgi:hypothetical protein
MYPCVLAGTIATKVLLPSGLARHKRRATHHRQHGEVVLTDRASLFSKKVMRNNSSDLPQCPSTHRERQLGVGAGTRRKELLPGACAQASGLWVVA